ncbi:MAG: F0F1 ATP synthase subunit B' [Paracoccaceae bacterium]
MDDDIIVDRDPLGTELAADPGTVVIVEDAAGMPQLDFSTFPNQIFWLLIALAAIYLILTRLALPRISAILAERSGTITNDVATAEDLKLQAREAEAAYEKALADARAEAGRIGDETRARIQADLDSELAKADERIAAQTAESEAAIAEVRAQAETTVAQVAREAAAAVVEALGVEADRATVDAAVEARTRKDAA